MAQGKVQYSACSKGTSNTSSGSSGGSTAVRATPVMQPPWMGVEDETATEHANGHKEQRSVTHWPAAPSTCVEPDHKELIYSVSTVLARRIRDSEQAECKVYLPLFCEDTHTEPPVADRFEVTVPLLHVQTTGLPTLFGLRMLEPLPTAPRSYPVPEVHTLFEFIENIWHKARLTPQSLVICLVYADRLEAKSEGVLLHARSWRPIVFASLLLASKVYHDISYWNSDFSTICPMFTVPNINRMERAYLELLQYNTIISASQYASYYFSLRATIRQLNSGDSLFDEEEEPEGNSSYAYRTTTGTRRSSYNGNLHGGGGNFRNKYFMAINVAGSSKLQDRSAAVARQQASRNKEIPSNKHNEDFQLFQVGMATSL